MQYSLFILRPALVSCALTLALVNQAYAAGEPHRTEGNRQADNSASNKASDGQTGISADQQGNSEPDVALTRKIRQAIVADKSLSTYAHNVKIITANGEVVLKGPVNSVEEKDKIARTAMEMAGAGKVKNEIEVAAR